MDSYVILGFSIVVLLILCIIKKLHVRTYDSKCPIIHKEIKIMCKNKIINITRNELYDMLSQFERNISKSMDIINEDNCYDLQVNVDNSSNSLKNWIKHQTDPVFKQAEFISDNNNENDIENEVHELSNNITKINDILYNSKHESEIPVEDNKDNNTIGKSTASINKTKTKMYHLQQDINIIKQAIIQCKCKIVGILNITPFKKLMENILFHMKDYSSNSAQNNVLLQQNQSNQANKINNFSDHSKMRIHCF